MEGLVFAVNPEDVIERSIVAVEMCDLNCSCTKFSFIKDELNILKARTKGYAEKARGLERPVTRLEQFELFGDLRAIEDSIAMLTKIIKK